MRALCLTSRYTTTRHDSDQPPPQPPHAPAAYRCGQTSFNHLRSRTAASSGKFPILTATSSGPASAFGSALSASSESAWMSSTSWPLLCHFRDRTARATNLMRPCSAFRHGQGQLNHGTMIEPPRETKFTIREKRKEVVCKRKTLDGGNVKTAIYY